MKRYESRLCTFAVPDDWVAEPPFAFREPGEREGRFGAQILERFSPEIPSVAEYAQRHKEILAELFDSFESFQEGPYRPEGQGDGYCLTFHFRDENSSLMLGKVAILACGPLLVELLLSGLAENEALAQKFLNSIVETFSLTHIDFMAGARKQSLQVRPHGSDTRSSFPYQCVSISTPKDWMLVADEDEIVFTQGRAEIRLLRELRLGGDSDLWFTENLGRLQETGERLIGSGSGEIGEATYVIQVYEEGGGSRSWKTHVSAVCVEVLVSGQQDLLWSLRTTPERFVDNFRSLEELISATEFLDPAQWRIRLPEPWLDCTLEGPWRPQAPGIYAYQTRPMFISLSSDKAGALPERVWPLIVDSLRRGADLNEGFSEQQQQGEWNFHTGFSYSLDGVSRSSDDICMRALWLFGEQQTYSLLVKGESQGWVSPVFLRLVDALRVARRER